MDKRELRKVLLEARQSIAPDVWQAKSHQLCEQLRSSSLFTEAQTILAYFSIRQEPDLGTLFAAKKMTAEKMTAEKTWGFPRCVGKSLVWQSWSPQASLPLQAGAYGILEPHPDAPVIEAEQVDLLLVPAIACDEQGYRLGYGGGFYDRLLTTRAWSPKATIGIVFDEAYVLQLPHDLWDQPLTAVCTESRFCVMT